MLLSSVQFKVEAKSKKKKNSESRCPPPLQNMAKFLYCVSNKRVEYIDTFVPNDAFSASSVELYRPKFSVEMENSLNKRLYCINSKLTTVSSAAVYIYTHIDIPYFLIFMIWVRRFSRAAFI